MNTVDAYLYTTKPLKDIKGPSEGTTDSVDALENVAAVYPATRSGILALWEAIWDDVEENRVTLKNVNDDKGDAMDPDDRIMNLELYHRMIQKDPMTLNRYLLDGAIHRISIIKEPFEGRKLIDSITF